jgi:hypothetical protein
MYRVVGPREDEVAMAESFADALRTIHGMCSDNASCGGAPSSSETMCYIEAVGETATARMYYPYVFEFAIKSRLIKDGRLIEPLVEPPVTELIAAFSRVAILQMTRGMGCH